MKAFIKRLLVLGIVTSSVAQIDAAQISGEISFGGKVTLVGGGTATATGISGFEGIASGNRPHVLGGSGTGSYAGIPGLTPVNWQPFSFNDTSVSPLWAFEFNGINYSFQATSISVFNQNSFFIDLRGSGMADIDGMDSTPGSWRLTINGNSSVFTFGGNTIATPNVPDAGSTLSLLGTVLLGMALTRHKLKK